MTLFEYTAVAASLVISFTVVRLLGGVSPAVDPSRRYWVHVTWIVYGLLNATANWWTYWSYNDVSWNYSLFLLSLMPLAVAYVVAALLVPEGAREIVSWRTHFYRIRKRFYSLQIAYLGLVIVCTVALLGHPVLHVRRVLRVSMIAVLSAGIAFESEGAQVVVLCLFLGINLIAGAVFIAPGSFGVAP